jgi:lysophospholipase L1-like esterase
VEIQPEAIVLFQGDSVTDAGRNQKNYESLGSGYVMMTAAWFLARHAERKVRFLNRGVSGNGIEDLKNRWQKDCLKLRPNVVSVLIGINDTLGRYFWNSPTSIEDFEENYRQILEQTRDPLRANSVRAIVLIEPFIVGIAKQQLNMREDLNPKIEVVRKLSKEFMTRLVPLDGIFKEAIKKREPSFWSQDGIHPTLAGHALIAQSWLEVMTSDLMCL